MNRRTVLGHYIIIQTLTGPPNPRVYVRFILQASYTANTNNNKHSVPHHSHNDEYRLCHRYAPSTYTAVLYSNY